jgi:putative transposase
MQAVGRRYVRYFNDSYGRTGSLWEGRYRATLIDSERYLFTCYRYIEMNPVRAGLVPHPRQYPWSSYRANALGQPDALIAAHEQWYALGDDNERRQEAYRGLFDQVLDEQVVTQIRGATRVRPGSDRGQTLI